MHSERVSSSCSTSGTRRVNLVTNSVISSTEHQRSIQSYHAIITLIWGTHSDLSTRERSFSWWITWWQPAIDWHIWIFNLRRGHTSFIIFFSTVATHIIWNKAFVFIENTYIIRADSFSYPADLTSETTNKIITNLTISFAILLRKCGKYC